MHLGDKKPAPADDEEDDISDGEALFTVLAAALTEAKPLQKLRIAKALNSEAPWESLQEDDRELFEGAAYAFLGEDTEETEDENEGE